MTDVPINPSSLVTNGATVGPSNPLPCTSASSPGSAGTDVPINPRTLVVNGGMVTALNPLVINLS